MNFTQKSQSQNAKTLYFTTFPLRAAWPLGLWKKTKKTKNTKNTKKTNRNCQKLGFLQ
jgi:hypothetical protein